MSIFDEYERGLEKLLSLIPKTASDYLDVLTLQTSLHENIEDARLYGDTPELKATRIRILAQLNRITVNVTVTFSFNDLCSGKGPAKTHQRSNSQPPDKNKIKKVFISHSSVDKDFASRLCTDLQNTGLPVWFDMWDIKVGESIVKKINQGLEQSDYLVVVFSPDSANSAWVQQELDAALMEQLSKKNITVLPLLLRECEIPILLRSIKYADFRYHYQSGLEELLKVFDPQNLSLAIS